MASARPSTSGRLRTLARAFPTQLREGFALGSGASFRTQDPPDSIVVSGLGGSAITGDLLAALLASDERIRVETTRGTTGRIGSRGTPLLAVSYSGGTRETLEAYREAGKRRAPRAAVTSGGALLREARAAGDPVVQLPPGLPPRGALGLLLGAAIAVLDPLLRHPFGPKLPARLAALEIDVGRWARRGAPPDRLARRIGDRRITIVAEAELAAAARRWANQFEENAKRMAHVELLPESMHNALAAWDAMRTESARREAFVLLGAVRPARTSDALAHLSSLLRRRGAMVERIQFDLEDRFVGQLSAVSFGDHLSLSLAEAAGVNPEELRAIDAWRRRSAR